MAISTYKVFLMKKASAGETYGAVRSDPVYGSCYGHRRNAVADT